MKKYALLATFIISAVNGMENFEQAYMALRSDAFSHFLDTYNIETEGRSILHIECATGALSAKLAEKASRIHGYDRNKKQIDLAKDTYHNLKNLSFQHCNSITFDFPRACDLVIIDYTTIDCYTNTNEKKKELFQCINQHLSHNGEIFLSIPTSDNTLHPNITTAIEMASSIQVIMPNVTEEGITELMMPSYPSLQELLVMLEETGFEIMISEEQSITTPISKNNVSLIYRNLILQNPILASIQYDNVKIQLGRQFLRNYIKKLEQDDNGNLLEPTITTIIHARKK